ncbi:hypothetical protein [Natrinema sp. 74]|uniref:hypothetical protein n=1 Tax=Natrinema sp. 74 TaxID=3384159 RepID=UPI0038D4C348
MRRSFVIAAVLLVLAFALVGGPSLLLSLSTDESAPAGPSTTTPTKTAEPDPDLISFDDSESGFWRYLSPSTAFRKRSPINVVVRGDVTDVEAALTEADGGHWSAVNESEEAALPDTYALFGGNDSDETRAGNGTATNESPPNANGTNNSSAIPSDRNRTESEPTRGRLPDLEWGEADGGIRYAYVDPGPNESGHWTTETLQLEDGTYYGQRYHIRLYESPNADDDWIAMQTHSEHFDWFTLRHRVHGSQDAQRNVESDFMAHPAIDVQDDVSRIYLDNGNSSDADGWATLVELAGLIVVPTLVGVRASGRDGSTSSETEHASRLTERTPAAIDDRLTDVDRRRLAAAYDRLEAGHLLLALAVVALLLGVRAGGIFLERHAAFLTPHQIAALLYPVIGVGIPAATYLIARGLTRRLDAAVVAAGSLAAAIWLDYGMLGVDTLPVDVVVQRMLVVVALGLIAGGAAERAARDAKINDMLLVGTAMWLVVLAGTLFGYF